VKLFDAHLGGGTSRFIQNEDLSNINKIGKLNALLKNAFSKKQDWNSVLINLRQKDDENVLIMVNISKNLKKGYAPQFTLLYLFLVYGDALNRRRYQIVDKRISQKI
jgi:hypothetical protein